MTRRRFTTKDRARIFNASEGRCHICGEKIDGVKERWDVEHLVPWELTRDDSDENLRPAHVGCHKAKTAEDIRAIRKSDRVRAKHLGTKAKSQRPLPGGREDKWKRKVSGEWVRRDA